MLRRRWLLIVAAIAGCLALGVLYIFSTEATYSARSELFVAPGSEPSSRDVLTGSAFYKDRVKTYAYIVKSEIVLAPVVDKLGLAESPRQLAERVSATAPIDTVLLSIRVTDTNPQRAADIANAVAEQFQKVALELEAGDESGGSPVVRVTTVQHATASTEPIAPNKKLILALAAMLGLAGGIALAVFREALNRRVRNEEELRAVTDLPIVGKIPEGDHFTGQLHGVRAEAFRQLRTNLQYLDIGETNSSLVITSALAAEGKSATAIGLAVSTAEAGMSVCLVEADLRRPRIAPALDLEPEVGLTTILIGAATIDQAIQSWGGASLDVITSGHLPPNPSQLLSSEEMSALVAALEQRYDVVVFDTPPVLAVTDAAIIAQRCSGAILVVSGGRRPVTREQLRQAIDNLSSAGVKLLGIVRNRMRLKGPDSITMTEYSSYDQRPPVLEATADGPT